MLEIEKGGTDETERMIWPLALQILKLAIAKVAEDNLGKEALNESIDGILLRNSEDATVILTDKTLNIAFDLKAAGKHLWSPAILQEKIEKTL